jgi:hypothetical protein
MSIHRVITSRQNGASTHRVPAARAAVRCDVTARLAGYRTRVSAMRVEAGCATERLPSIREFSREHTHSHGVHVAAMRDGASTARDLTRGG